MSYFKKLNLPQNPLKFSKAVTEIQILGGYNIVLPDQVLTTEIISIFQSIGLRPKMVVLFGRGDNVSTKDDRMIHTDLVEDKTHEKGWRKLVAGVNWEIEGSVNNFFWYDMSSQIECYPKEPNTPMKFKHLNGIHYGARLKIGIPENAVLLDQTTIDGPTLVRTDIPHATLYNNPTNTRVGVSVRFHEEDFNYSWDGALDKFATLIK